MNTIMRSSSACFMILMLAPAFGADDTSTSTDEPKKLSVAPSDYVVYPEDRPQWVSDVDDGGVGINPGIHFVDEATVVVITPPSETTKECADRLEILKRAAVEQYIVRTADSLDVVLQWFGSDQQNMGYIDFYNISDEEMDGFVSRSHGGSLNKGDMTMQELAVELTFPVQTRAAIRAAWEDKRQEIETATKTAHVRERLSTIGVVVFGGLIMLMCSSAVVGTISRRAGRRDRLSAGARPAPDGAHVRPATAVRRPGAIVVLVGLGLLLAWLVVS